MDGQMAGLGDFPGNSQASTASGVSADGSVIVGSGVSTQGTEAFRWENGVITGLGDLPTGSFRSEARAVSADGQVVVGFGVVQVSPSLGVHRAFRWENDVMVDLGYLPGGNDASEAKGTSEDGSVVVGLSSSESGAQAFVWTADLGIRSLKELLEDDFELNLDGWRLHQANGISADGRTIVGDGINPNGNQEAWMATIPEPGSLTLLTLGSLLILSGSRNRRMPPRQNLWVVFDARKA
jgi:probable HAF family extracellular repeat protein